MVQVNSTPITVRIKFKKVGRLQYISHLDLVRTMHKIIVRAALPLWYTEGFNPKPKMVFAAPLSIGTESETEFMDLRLTERMAEAELLERLNKNLTDEMQVLEVYYPETKLTELKWFSYTVTLALKEMNSDIAEKIEALLNSESVIVEKKSKPGEAAKSFDIAPLIKSANAVYNGEEIKLSLTLSADQSTFLNPEYIIRALKKHLSLLMAEKLTDEYYTVMRNSAYTQDMSLFR